MLVILLIFGFVESGGRENGLIFSEGIAVLTQNLGCFFSVICCKKGLSLLSNGYQIGF